MKVKNNTEIEFYVLDVYDHFAKDCPIMTVVEKEEWDQMQKLMDTEEHDSAVMIFAKEPCNSLTNAAQKI